MEGVVGDALRRGGCFNWQEGLSSFAASLNLPFEFRSVIVPDTKGFREDMFDLKEEEAVGVYSILDLSSLIVKPASLENESDPKSDA